MRSYPPDVRIDAIYISDVNLDQNQSTIQATVLADIRTVYLILSDSFTLVTSSEFVMNNFILLTGFRSTSTRKCKKSVRKDCQRFFTYNAR